MADSSLQVKITADVTSLQAKSAVAKAEYAALSASVRSLAKDYVTASEESKTALNAQLQSAVAAAEGEKAVLADLRAEIAKQSGESEVAQGAFAKLHESILGLGEQAEAVTGKISAFTGAFGAIGELAAVGFGAEVLGEQITKTAELGEAYAQLAEKTGATISQLAGLRLAAMQTGTDFDTVGNGVRELGIKMQDAIVHPAGDAAQAFKKLGVSITDSNGQMLPVIDVFAQISEKMASFQDGTAKTALASDVLGAKFGSALIPVINQVGDGFDSLQGKAQAYGLAMSQDEVEASERFAQSQKDMQASLIGVRTEIVGPLLGAFADIESALANNVLESQEVKSAAAAVSVAFATVVDVGVAVGTAIAEVTSLAFTLGETMGVVATEVLAAGEAMTGHLALALQTAKNGVDELKNSWVELGESIKTNEKLFATVSSDFISEAVGGPNLAPATTMTSLADHQGAGDQLAPQLAPAAPRGGGDRVSAARSTQDQITQIAQDAAQAQKQIQDSELQAQISNWNAEVAQGKLTKAAEIQDEISAKNQIYQADLQEAQKAAALDATGTAAKAKALDDIEVLTAQHNAEIAQLNADLVQQQLQDAKAVADAQKAAAEQAQQAWQRAVQPIETAFDGMLNGVLQGTQTLRGAEIKAAQDITLAFIDAEAKRR